MTQTSFGTDNSDQTEITAPDFKVGNLLRKAREEKKLTIESIADSLCIRAMHLRAIEESDYEQLPALVYARGFVRSYADYLKLNQAEILEKFRLETAGQEPVLDTVYVPSNANRQLPGKHVMIGGAVAFVFMLILWAALSSPSTPEAPAEAEANGTVEVVTEEGSEPVVADVAPEPVKPVPADNTPTSYANAAATNVAAPPPLDGQENLPSDANPAAAPDAKTPVVTTEALKDAAKDAPKDAAKDPAKDEKDVADVKPAVQSSGLSLEVLSDAWVEIKDSKDNVLFSRVLRKGEIYQVPRNLLGAYMTTGNAGGLMAIVNGEKVGILGKQGEVVHDLALESAKIARMAREMPR